MRVQVTEEDIAQARKLLKYKQSDRNCVCPIALALQRQGFPDAKVSWRSWANKSSSFPLPPVAHEFVCAFDDGVEVRPFSFDIQEVR